MSKPHKRFTRQNCKKAICLIHNPITIICEAQAKKAEFCFRNGEKQNGCSSEKERKVNALALRADEGRDNLR